MVTEYDLSQAAISQIIADEKGIIKLYTYSVDDNLNKKRVKYGAFKKGEAELNAWVMQKIDKGDH